MYIAALDQGTSSTRCILFDHSGKAASATQQEHGQVFPQPGWVEHDPIEIWERSQAVIRGAVAQVGAQPREIMAVGITNQRETSVVWNKHTGQPYYNAIVWQDTRTRDICDELSASEGQDRFRPRTGLPLATYFSGPKLKWLLDNVAGARRAAENGEAIFGNIDTWLIWWLTGGPDGGSHVTDVTNASRTMLMNLQSLDWDDEILDSLRIPRQMLPSITPSSDPETWGMTRPNGPFGDAVPICGNLGDQQAAMIGQTCYSVGDAKNTYGTGCFILQNTGSVIVPSSTGLLTTLAYKIGERPAVYALEGSIAVAGALVQWLRDNLKLFDFSHHIEDYARSVSDNGGMYIVPAFSGLFAPRWRSDARGVMVGLTRFIDRNHIARAALEATAYQTREVLDAMEQESGTEFTALKVDGGMVHNELLMQFQADILGVPVIRPKVSETTALGAAYAAGLAVGFWDTLEDLNQNWEIDKIWEPKMTDDMRAELYSGWQKAVERTLDWV